MHFFELLYLWEWSPPLTQLQVIFLKEPIFCLGFNRVYLKFNYLGFSVLFWALDTLSPTPGRLHYALPALSLLLFTSTSFNDCAEFGTIVKFSSFFLRLTVLRFIRVYLKFNYLGFSVLFWAPDTLSYSLLLLVDCIMLCLLYPCFLLLYCPLTIPPNSAESLSFPRFF